MNNPDLYNLKLDELGLRSSQDVSNEIFIKNFHRYKQSYVNSTPENKKDYHLPLFTLLLKDQRVYMTRLGHDEWIKDLINPVKIMFGSNKGRESTLVLYLGHLYRIALGIKSDQEEKIKSYPEIYKVDEKANYPTILLYHCFKIFQLTPVNDDPEKAKSLLTTINDLSNKLGLSSGRNGSSVLNSNTIKQSISPIFAVGADLLNKAQTNRNNGVQPTNPIKPENISNIIDNVFNTGGIQGILDDIRTSAQTGGGPPDMGALIGNIMSKMNPDSMLQTLQTATKSELPKEFTDGMNSPGPVGTKTESVPEKKEEQPILISDEEIIEETEEIIEEDE